MTLMKSVVVADGSVLLDTTERITAAMLPAIKAYRFNGQPVAGILRYVSLYQVNENYDISPDESQLIVDNFQYFGLVQHCLRAQTGKSTWTASPQLGALKGLTAKGHADLVLYPDDSMLAYDDEDVSGDIIGEINAWAANVGRPSLVYTGYAPGMTEQELYDALPDVHAYWGAAGAWDVAVRGVCMRQHQTVVIGGVGFDPNIASADKLGGRAVLATAA
jgi:hypothetical protein